MVIPRKLCPEDYPDFFSSGRNIFAKERFVRLKRPDRAEVHDEYVGAIHAVRRGMRDYGQVQPQSREQADLEGLGGAVGPLRKAGGQLRPDRSPDPQAIRQGVIPADPLTR